MYTKACGNVLINSSQDESLNDATQTPDCVDRFRMTRKPTPSYLCTCRKRDYVINITINAPNAFYINALYRRSTQVRDINILGVLEIVIQSRKE